MKKEPFTNSYMLVKALSARATTGRLHTNHRSFPCQMGHSGRSALKAEGDGATPIGNWPIIEVYYRADRVARPLTSIPIKAIQPDDGWCDEPMDRNYNRPVPLPYDASTENLWRRDHAYDLLIVLDNNFTRRSINRGSAIFMHLSHDNLRPTAGCLAFSERHLRMILKPLKTRDIVKIAG